MKAVVADIKVFRALRSTKYCKEVIYLNPDLRLDRLALYTIGWI